MSIRITFLSLALSISPAFGGEPPEDHPSLLATDKIVFDGKPQWRVVTTMKGTEREMLTEEQRNENREIIAHDGRRYVWVNRGRTSVQVSRAGNAWIFVDYHGGGYLKVVDQRRVSVSKPLADFSFYSHLHAGMKTVSYFGENADIQFTPPE